jgi:hypothetical protein
MKIFDMADNKVVFDSALLMVPEFKKLWDEDKSKTKDIAFKQFAYIYFICDSGSPYANFPDEKRKEAVAKDMFKGEVKETPNLHAAMQKFKELAETPTQRLLTSVKKKIDQIATYLDTTVYDDDNSSSQLKSIESTSKLVAQLAVLEDAVNKEKATANTKRSGEKRTRKYED